MQESPRINAILPHERCKSSNAIVRKKATGLAHSLNRFREITLPLLHTQLVRPLLVMLLRQPYKPPPLYDSYFTYFVPTVEL